MIEIHHELKMDKMCQLWWNKSFIIVTFIALKKIFDDILNREYEGNLQKHVNNYIYLFINFTM